MQSVNEINKIKITDDITIKDVKLTTLLFDNGKIVSKRNYAITDHYINLTQEPVNFLNLYTSGQDSSYYEYSIVPRQGMITIQENTKDLFNNALTGLFDNTVIVFLNNKKINSSDFDIVAPVDNEVYPKLVIHTFDILDSDLNKPASVILYVSKAVASYGELERNPDWNSVTQELKITTYIKSHFMFFKNGLLIPHDKIFLKDNVLTISTPINFHSRGDVINNIEETVGRAKDEIKDMARIVSTLNAELEIGYMKQSDDGTYLGYYDSGTLMGVVITAQKDNVEFYSLATDCVNNLFDAKPGYSTYGPTDKFRVEVPLLFDTRVTFSTHIARIAIDDLRLGFFIKEEETLGNGSLMIVDTDFETKEIKCIRLAPFSKTTLYKASEFFIQVPEARSITHYLSNFDLAGKLFPEILSIFQKVLLNETYDTIQRVKNIRSITKTSNENVTNLLNFLGMNINTTNLSIEKKRALLEEVNNFYRIVGTKASYNFYNISATKAKIVGIDQLFTPIKDMYRLASGEFVDINALSPEEAGLVVGEVKRYVTFSTMEELNAELKREYQYPKKDFGQVFELAQDGDSLTNSPNFEGVLEWEGDVNFPATYKKPVLNDTATFYTSPYEDSMNPGYIKVNDINTNMFTSLPVAGPNQPTTDFGFIELDENGHVIPVEDFESYGDVSEIIKGEWVEWYEWDRDKNWYPTNHVNVSVEIPADVDYDTFMREFRKTFYDIASAVLYIHSIIDVYVFGNDKLWEEGQKPIFGLMTSPIHYNVTHTFTSNPNTVQPGFHSLSIEDCARMDKWIEDNEAVGRKGDVYLDTYINKNNESKPAGYHWIYDNGETVTKSYITMINNKGKKEGEEFPWPRNN